MNFPQQKGIITWTFTNKPISLPSGISYIKYQTLDDLSYIMVYLGNNQKGLREYSLLKSDVSKLEQKIKELYNH